MKKKLFEQVVAVALACTLASFWLQAGAQGPVGSWHGTAGHANQGISGSTVATSAWQMLCGRGDCYLNPDTNTWVHVSGQTLHVFGTAGNPVTGMVTRPGQVASKVARGALQPASVPLGAKVRAIAGGAATAAYEAVPAVPAVPSEVGVVLIPGWMQYCLPHETVSTCQRRILGTTTG